ncbi:transposase [Prevotella aurantiaca]|jgi:transposase domain protein|uniref:transposase n=1 Tax=Prevotella aurantiaca TaxID=596085 RepID=UPI002357E6C7|nr:transposase [Prevotella aurantiaca]
MIKRHVSFSQLVTLLRLTLMYYTDFISFMENPQNDELIIMAKKATAPPKELDIFD